MTLPRAPDGVNCISFKLTDENGASTSYQFAMNRHTIRIRNIPIGAYDLTAVAYFANVPDPITDADCQSVPIASPWATANPTLIVIQNGQLTQVSITLVQTGRVAITAQFVLSPEVVAQTSTHAGAMVANNIGAGPFIAWGINSTSGPNGQVMGLFDSPGNVPFTIASNQTNVGEMAIDPSNNFVYWENFRTGTTDGNGHIINDGTLWVWDTISAQQVLGGLNPTDLGFAVANHTAYLGDFTTSSINCFPCAQPLAINEPVPQALMARGNKVTWGRADGVVKIMNVTDAAPTQIANLAPRQAYGVGLDDDFVYTIDFATGGDIDQSNVQRIPVGGGPVVPLVTGTLAAFPIVAFNGFVYYSDGEGLKRVDRNGGVPAETVVTGQLGGFALTTVNGHDTLYWTDDHFGLVWRGRLN
ncbi:MAG TPA: hypothetical protein VKE22_25950 [Haliangiales bacterium]|nr:hypothetical protein [Haliangiales bacterium]